MPSGDGTGPMGTGPMTGRGAGYCADVGMPGYQNPMPGRGRGMGRGWGRGGGRGRGWRHQFHAAGQPSRAGSPPAEEVGQEPVSSLTQDIQLLKEQAQRLESTLADIQRRISELPGALVEPRD